MAAMFISLEGFVEMSPYLENPTITVNSRFYHVVNEINSPESLNVTYRYYANLSQCRGYVNELTIMFISIYLILPWRPLWQPQVYAIGN